MAQSTGDGDGGGMRKHYKQADRAELLTAVHRGEPIASAARRLGVTMSTAYRWVRRPGKEAPTPTFIELVTAGGPSASVILRVGGAELEVRPGFDRELLRAVVAALGGDA